MDGKQHIPSATDIQVLCSTVTRNRAEKRSRIIVTGRVQGVFFRASTVQRATALGVSGWVRNLPDGRVEIVAEGASDAVDTLISWARRGPEAARVLSTSVHDEPPRGESGFGVRYDAVLDGDASPAAW